MLDPEIEPAEWRRPEPPFHESGKHQSKPRLGANYIPQTFVISPTGKLILQRLGAVDRIGLHAVLAAVTWSTSGPELQCPRRYGEARRRLLPDDHRETAGREHPGESRSIRGNTGFSAALSAVPGSGILLGLFERFTERARQVVVLAEDESRTLQHNYIGTEHILLGLLREEDGLAARVLESLEITVDGVQRQVLRIVGRGEQIVPDQVPFTPRAKNVLELALRESLSLGHNYIGTEHILLGLVRESEGVAVRILLDFNADAETIRREIIRLLSGPEVPEHSEEVTRVVSHGTRHSMDQAWFDGLGGVLTGLEREIRRELGREPDAGDLLVALVCAPDTLAAQALRELGLDLDRVRRAIELARAQRSPGGEDLARRIAEVRCVKEQAIESRQFETAALARDQERGLNQQQRHRADAGVPPDVLHQIRRQLGLSSHTEHPPKAPEHS